MHVFFYGLFMDRELLATKGVSARDASIARLHGFRLKIGERASLFRDDAAETYGVVMELDDRDVDALYSEESVRDYKPVPVSVVTNDGREVDAFVYVLPESVASQRPDEAYVRKLVEAAQRVGLPARYTDSIASGAVHDHAVPDS